MGIAFDVVVIRATIAEVRARGPDCSYVGFSKKVVAAGYTVPVPGQCAVYSGCAGETHIVHFRQ